MEIMPTLGKFDLLLTDPPYGIGVQSMTLGNRVVKPLFRGDETWDATAPDLSTIIDQCRHAVVWGGNYMNLPVIGGGWLVWDKQNGGTDFSDCELAWTNRSGALRMLRKSWNGSNAKERNDHDRHHPTQKPIELMSWCIGFFDGVASIIDPFMGSGTSCLAAKSHGIPSVGIEREERYCEIAALRLTQGVLF
jgi:DNA modification methylase